MCEQTEINYLDGDVVWVKLGSCWWPGKVVALDKLPPDVLPSFRKPPIATVKFFQEDTYEYVKNHNSIYKYDCSRKNEFINKGLSMHRTKPGNTMDKFPEDVIQAEKITGGDIDILTRDEFQEKKKESYAGLFGDPGKKTPLSVKKGRGRPLRSTDTPKSFTPINKALREKSDYKVHILLQSPKPTSQSAEATSTPSTSRSQSEAPEDKPEKQEETVTRKTITSFSTPSASGSGLFSCHACAFTTTRLNVIILHNKTHSVTYMPYTPSPVKQKTVTKASPKSPKIAKTQTPRRPRKDKIENVPKKSKTSKRSTVDTEDHLDTKKIKTDEEIKSSLLADWDDGEEEDEESNDLSSSIALAHSPEVAAAAESAVASPAELPGAQVAVESSSPEKKEDDCPVGDKPESSDSKYEFCEDEDWPLEKDGGRKIPRVKNASKRKEDSKSIDEDDMAKEVAELLNKTTLPELPSVPEPLKVEGNFPEPSIIKSPDKQSLNNTEGTKALDDPEIKKQPTKAIFKTKTFFRSRHSRSQDAIGKYVAEQLNAAERMDLSECELNGSDNVSSPEARDSPPVEQVKVAKLAPKIQLKKMKAEAAQLREKEKLLDKHDADTLSINTIDNKSLTDIPVAHTESLEKQPLQQDVLYPTQEIKPINKESFINKPLKKLKMNKNYYELMNDFPDMSSEVKILNKNTFLDSTETAKESNESFISEPTASAVDALLSVSREADSVTKIVSDDPPEDLFEDDIKETSSNENGFNYNKEVRVESTSTNYDIQKELDDLNSGIAKNVPLNSQKQEEDIHLHKIIEDAVGNEVRLQNDIPDIIMESDEKECAVGKPANVENVIDNIPSESDLQIAEALINLPATALNVSIENQNNLLMTSSFETEEVQEETVVISTNLEDVNEINSTLNQNSESKEDSSFSLLKPNNDNINPRFETEEEKSENLTAAQSLVQMSESIDLKMQVVESNIVAEENVIANNENTLKPKQSDDSITGVHLVTNKESPVFSDKNSASNGINSQFDKPASKLLKILEEPVPSRSQTSKVVTKPMIVTSTEKILNFDVSSSPIRPKAQSPKQKIIIRRAAPTKNVINLNETTASEKIILSRSNKASSDSVQTYTIQASPDASSDTNTIIVQPKIRKIIKTSPKQHKIVKEQISNVSSVVDVSKSETCIADDAMFDINSMPIVLSDEILTPENIDRMPIVMSDGNIITKPVLTPIVATTPSKVMKTKQVIHTEKIAVTSLPNKPEVKQKNTVLNITEVNKATPNILSKSSKIRQTKPMLVIDKTGKQKFIMTNPDSAIKEIKQAPAKIQPVPQTSGKSEKFIILPSPASPRPTRTQKIVIDPQTGKAHVLVSKGPEMPVSAENKPVAAKLIPSQGDATTPGNTVMIITNAQGAQSRIILTPEHEKILFPNKQQPNISQLKSIVQSTRVTNSAPVLKTVITTSAPARNQTKIVPKQKSAIITSKGQLIVGGRMATSVQNIAPMPEVRQATTEVRTMPKRIIASEPKKLVQTIQKNSSEPLIFLQQKSGTVMQLTKAQFEHLQRTGEIVQKPPIQESKKIIVQKSITIPAKDPSMPPKQTKKVRKTILDSSTPAKKVKHEISVPTVISTPMQSSSHTLLTPGASFFSLTTAASPSLTPSAPVPSLAPLSHSAPHAPSTAYSELDNLEELLPSTAIVRQQEPTPIEPPAPIPQDPPTETPLADAQLLAAPGETFGGPPGTFYLCFEDAGTLTPIDNRPLVLENNQLVPMIEPPAPERRDILEAALANSDVFHADPPYREPAPCVVSETSTTLHQPIMTPVEVPSKSEVEPAVQHSIEEGLAVIGVTPGTVSSPLELPITVTDPRIAQLGSDVVGKSMPLLTDDAADASSAGSPASLEDAQWARRLLTPTSDVSDASSELPLQPPLRLSLPDLSRPV